MKVGDLVKTTGDAHPNNWVGIIMKIIHYQGTHPDYRTPSQFRVFFPDQKTVEHCYRSELKLVMKNESR